ncbi:MAG TPA: lipoyl synthase, partial [Syntrophales bacterium]|nr:lipoyl synthase [Syntrophales bacterium]
MRKPDWLKVPLPNTREFMEVRGILDRLDLHSVCQEARCPNMGECFQSRTATFLILGNKCTRNCRYCNVQDGQPGVPDENEPERLAEAVKALGLRYVVITSVTRDDLTDGGAALFARCIELLRKEIADCRVEVLIPDLQGNWTALQRILASGPHVLNHNIEVVPRLFGELRPRGNYALSLELLRRAGEDYRKALTKSGFMVGFGETRDEILSLLDDLAEVACASLTIGQYLQPSAAHWPVAKFYMPDEFEDFRQEALLRGFKTVVSGPLVRSSYQAAK